MDHSALINKAKLVHNFLSWLFVFMQRSALSVLTTNKKKRSNSKLIARESVKILFEEMIKISHYLPLSVH